MVKKGQDEFKAGKISVNLDTEDIILDGRVRGSVEQKKEEKDTAVQEAEPLTKEIKQE